MPRRTIKEPLKREVLTESGYRCAVPTCRTILAIDLHHIEEVSEGGGNELINLIALCPNCHALYHRGTIHRDSIKVWKGMLITLNGAFDKITIDYLKFLNSQSPRLELTGDGVLRFSRLISSNLAKYDVLRRDNFTHDPKYMVELTEKGRLIVQAWLTGDLKSLEKVL